MNLENMFAKGKKITLQVEVTNTQEAIELINYCLGEKKNESVCGVKIDAVDFLSRDQAETGENFMRDLHALMNHYRKPLGNKIGHRINKEDADALSKSLNFPVKVLTIDPKDPTKSEETWI